MPIRYTIDTARRVVVSTGKDRLTYVEVRDHQDRLIVDRRFDPTFNQLIDLTTLTDLAISTEEAQKIATRRLFSPTSRRAYVAIRPHIFGIGRLMQAHHDLAGRKSEVEIFDDLDQAKKWLGLETESIPS